jgi:hypothetical protein
MQLHRPLRKRKKSTMVLYVYHFKKSLILGRFLTDDCILCRNSRTRASRCVYIHPDTD